MPKLTGEELSKLYPTAKTYDELQQEKEQRQEIMRPKFVAEKIAFCMALGIVVVCTVYAFISGITGTFNDGSVEATMTGVCLTTLLVLLGAAALYYIYKLIDELVSKTIVTTPQFYAMLGGVVFTTGIIAMFCRQLDILLLAPLCMLFACTATYIGTKMILKRQ